MAKFDRVSRVAFFPIKGAHEATVDGAPPTSLSVGETGFEVRGVRDRDFVLYDPNEDTFVSQRGWGGSGKKVKYPQDRRLATVELDVNYDHILVQSGAGKLELPTRPEPGRTRKIQIFGKRFPAIEQATEASEYFSRLLDREVLLVRSDRDDLRVLPVNYQRRGAFNQVAGADGMPFLLTSERSLAAAHEANGMEPGTVPIDRYRANIVVQGDGLGPFGEDYIDGAFSVGDIGMWAVKACSRCPVPDIDQETGLVVGGALRVLRGRAGNIFTGEEGVFFGQNLVHRNVGTISVGDFVQVDAMAEVPNVALRAAAP